MKPISSPVARPSGRATANDKVVENRISEKTGASAQPKNAVLI